jgi:7-cyano-7-deazaguanine synthase
MSDPIIYVLLSGGIDSATALGLAVEKVDEVRCVTIDYGQRHRREIEAAAALAEIYDCEYDLISMPMGRTMLTDPTIEVPDVDYSEIIGVSPTYVPFRNGLMLSTVASYIAGRHHDLSQRFIDPGDGGIGKPLNPDYDRDCLIYWGAHAEDAAGGAYPDCTAEFVGAMSCAIAIATSHKVRLVAPFVAMSKAEVVERGSLLGVSYRWTWSCYKGGEKHCGVCPTCRARKRAFLDAEVADPTEYAE